MGDIADDLYEQMQEEYADHIAGVCEFECRYCVAEGEKRPRKAKEPRAHPKRRETDQ